MKIRRALISVWDKTGLEELARAFVASGTEILASGGTGEALARAGIPYSPVESITQKPEAFDGRMKTLAFEIGCGILYRRGHADDERDLQRLGILPIDAVVINFYPFLEKGTTEAIDIGGPTWVRAAAKNAPDVLVATHSSDYSAIVEELQAGGEVSEALTHRCAALAWERILDYDAAIARKRGTRVTKALRYGENPHQKGLLEFDPNGPIDYAGARGELSTNNLLDLASAYGLMSDLLEQDPTFAATVIVKHNNPCGVAAVPSVTPRALRLSLSAAWDGDPVSAFGGVVVFSQPIGDLDIADLEAWFKDRFVEVIAAPELRTDSEAARRLIAVRKNIKLVPIRRWGEVPSESLTVLPGARVFQSRDHAESPETLRTVSQTTFPQALEGVARFGIAAGKHLRSNAIAIVRALPGVEGAFQLIGAGQGQPNRVDALKALAIPRAQECLARVGGKLSECVLVSDAFFPFADSIEAAHAAGLRYVVEPGGSQRDAEVIAACDAHSIALAFTGVRHFKH